MKGIFLFSLWTICLISSYQALSQFEDYAHLYHRTSALLHPNYPSNNIGLELYPVPGKLSISGEIGFLAQGDWTQEDFTNSRKYFLELRYYVGRERNRPFAGILWHRRDITTSSNYVIGYDCGAGDSRDCARYEDFTGNISARLNAWQVTLGTQTLINDWMYLDSYMGIGQGNHRLDRSTINGGKLVERNRFWQEKSFGPERIYLYFTLKLGIRIDTIVRKVQRNNADPAPDS